MTFLGRVSGLSWSCLCLVSVMSRCGFGEVSVMCRSWFCVAWVMSRGVTVMSRSCFRNALLMFR